MGADIHTRVEYKPKGHSEWFEGDYYMKNRWHKIYKEEPEYVVAEVCGERNYHRFALLADVRNDGLIEPICEPKGIPDDCCESVKEEIERWGDDGHSHSYFTLAELIEWHESHESKFKVRGMISPEQAKMLDEEGIEPECWCGWTSDESWVEREWEMDYDLLKPLIDELKQRMDALFYGARGHEKDIRIVFWFDN